EILQLCDNRCVLFDNKTKDEAKRTEQAGKLLSLVNSVIVETGGQPYTDEFLAELKRGATELCDQQAEVDSLKEYSKQEISKLMGQMQESYEDQIKRITEMVFFTLLVLASKYDMHMRSFLISDLEVIKTAALSLPLDCWRLPSEKTLYLAS
ncbi:hypothetical protein CISIN_1g0384611mg, partial [Citrus sinensis]